MDADRSYRTRTLWLCSVLHGFTHLYLVALLPLYVHIQKDLRLGGIEQATLLVTIMGLAYFIPSYPLGVLADRMSRTRLLAVGLAINGMGFAVLSFAPNHACALAAVVLAGLGGSAYHPAATALVSSLYPEDKGRALGFLAIGASVGLFAGPAYVGWRAVVLNSWRTPVLELGLLGIAAAAVFAWLAKEERVPGSEATPRHQAETMFPTAPLWLFFLAVCLAFSSRDFAGDGMRSLTSLFLQKAQGLQFDSQAVGIALSGLFLVSTIGNPLFAGLSEGKRIRWIFFVLVTAATLMSVFPRVPFVWMIPVLMLYGFLFVSSFPIVQAALMDSVPDNVRGRVCGLFISVGGLAGNLAHWVVGHWVERLGPSASAVPVESFYPLYGCLSCLVLLSLLGLPCLHAIRKREHLEVGRRPLGSPELDSPRINP